MVANLARAWGVRFIEPIARLLQRAGLTPNAVTVLGFILTAAVAVVVATGQFLTAGLLLIVTLGADALDGALARLTGNVTRFGAFLDSTLDRWAEVTLYGALVWYYLRLDQDLPVLLAVAALATSLLVSYTRARAEGAGLQCKEGVFTRFERLVVLIAGLIFNLVVPALWLIAVLAGLTAVQRIWIVWQADQSAG